MNTLLYISDYLIDVDPSIEVALTIQANDIAELKDRQSALSNQFKCLLTANNKAAFDYANKVQSTSAIAYTRMSCRLVQDGTHYVGYLILDKTSDAFYTTFYGGNAEFFKLIEGLKLIDLDFTALDQLWNFTNMVAAYGSTSSPTVLLVDDGTMADTGRTVDLRQQYFSMYVQTVFEKIITEQGFTFEGSLFTDYKYLKSFLPFTNDKPLRSDEEIELNRVHATRSATITGYRVNYGFSVPMPFDVEVADAGNNWSGSFEYTPPSYNYHVDVQVSIKLNWHTESGVTWSYGFVMIYNGVATTIANFDHSDVASLPSEINFSFSAAEIAAGSLSIEAVGSGSGMDYDFLVDSFIKVTPIEELQFNDVWNISLNLPDLSQKDFLKAIMQMFGVIVDTDGINKSIRFELFNTVIENKINAPNIDQYIDYSQEHQSEYHPSTYAQKNWLRYKNDDTVTKYFGDGYFNIADEILAPEKTLFTLPFAASNTVIKLHDITVIEVLRVGSSKPEPRILLYGGTLVTGTPYGSITLTDGTSTSGQGIFESGYFSEVIWLHSLDVDSLIVDYYADIINMLTNYRKITVATFYDPTFINQLDLFTPLFSTYFNSYFYLNKINNHKLSKASQTELIRL